jgi:biotin synthase-like enzyme
VRFCIVNSGRGPTAKEIQDICGVVREIKSRVDINICCSLGLMDEEKIETLKDAGVERINHNLNTSERHHPDICTTHTYADRVETVTNVKSVGLSSCCGGIVGMGETDDDLMDLAGLAEEARRRFDPDQLPPPDRRHAVRRREDADAAALPEILCMFRFVNPDKELRVGGGREINLRSLQPLSLYPANSLFVERLSDHARNGDERDAQDDRRHGLRDRRPAAELIPSYFHSVITSTPAMIMVAAITMRSVTRSTSREKQRGEDEREERPRAAERNHDRDLPKIERVVECTSSRGSP